MWWKILKNGCCSDFIFCRMKQHVKTEIWTGNCYFLISESYFHLSLQFKFFLCISLLLLDCYSIISKITFFPFHFKEEWIIQVTNPLIWPISYFSFIKLQKNLLLISKITQQKTFLFDQPHSTDPRLTTNCPVFPRTKRYPQTYKRKGL